MSKTETPIYLRYMILDWDGLDSTGLDSTGGLKTTPCLYQHRPVHRAHDQNGKMENGKKIKWS
nr:MAG TPA: hypothetical protein [Bacteriophage sp.]